MTLSSSSFDAQTTVRVQRSEDGDAAIVSVPASGVDLEAVERALIAFALRATTGNRTRAASFLGLTRSALLYRMHKYELSSQQGPS
jgi:DNA-binding NtrC family response regulator